MTMQRIQLLKELPGDLGTAQLVNVHQTALDFCAAVLEYVTIGVKKMSDSWLSLLPQFH